MTVDIILLLVILVFILSGYRKGLILSLCTLLILIISCMGASVAQELLTPKLVAELQPELTASISQQLEEQVSSSVDEAITSASDAGITIAGKQVTLGDLIDLLDSLGLDVQQGAQDTAQDISGPIVASAASAMAASILNTVMGFLIFTGAFLIIFLVLRTAELALNTVDRLPVIHTLNHLGGGIVGLVSGAFFLTMVMAVLARVGLVDGETFRGPVSGMLHGIVASFL